MSRARPIQATESGLPREGDINLHIGRRLRRRRRLLGMTQQMLGDATELTFQQIQKYECASNRISAARLHSLAAALNVPVQYFFEGLSSKSSPATRANDSDCPGPEETSSSVEARDFMDVYLRLPGKVRGKLREFAKALIEL